MHVAVRGTRRIDVGAISRIGLGLSLTTLLVVAAGSSVKDATALNETRTLSFHHTHSGEDLTVTFKRNGRYDEDALKKLNHHLRDWRSQDSTTMDRRLFDILWEVYRDVGGKQPINIISAYRSPQTNAMLRRRSSGVARFSQHMRGHAIDFFIPGVALSDIRTAGLRLQRGGVGFYPSSGSPFVHLDTGSVRHWPRMTHDQLAAVFPNGRTVHIPSNGNPLKGYDLAAADIERREKSGDFTSARGTKGFLASLFSSKSDEDDEAPANEPAPKDQKVAQASRPAKNEAVPLPRMRPQASYQVASASGQPTNGPTGDTKPQTIADLINARGFWDEVAAPKQATPAQVAALAARAAVADARASANVTPATAQALAYAPPSAMFDRSNIVAASAPLPRSARPVNAGANPMAADTIVAKGMQSVPTLITRTARSKPESEVWVRAMVLAPNSYRFMLPTVLGEPDMTALRAHFVKPLMAIAVTFAEDATPGLRCDSFTGSAFGTLPKVSFRMQTAELH
ncbi:DUF882 domain-containing protein [Bradyrhizobium sp. LHD-71]|uniref:DUF882 domain-containing protein n=1 Tax=Bradyrhizobium sp. LHD-71 TaxID=3072141 RepID=UPI00280F168F|nr:DUF882 domain-containing protein [Bradyrhizobium sp. LHD-71]MDQ8726910.1 DUF882 domain-containing protein [Bradyrhizobium sp. LHD-71]